MPRLAVLVLLPAALAAQSADPPEKGSPAKEPAATQPVATDGAAAREPATPVRFTTFPVADGAPLAVADATRAAIAELLALQEGEQHDQWPYEGVYREDRGQLPVGYRVGGTSIVCLSLLAAPGYAADADRQAAVRRGLAFVLATLDHDRMQIGFLGTYDVRGWGHIYALQLLLDLQDGKLVPDGLADEVAAKTAFCVKALCALAIPTTGGWNYSMRGLGRPGSPASPFMTAPALQALFHAKARGHDVPDAVLDEALDALERGRTQAGGYAYGAGAEPFADVPDGKLSMMHKLPGSAARATAVEATLLLAGRGDPARLRDAVHRFFADWDELAVRKSRTGTHIPPYGVAPYYFLYGHLYAAQAIELLADADERTALRARMLQYLARSRDADGTWNDRHFARSAGYGTALALLVMHMPHLRHPVPRPVGK